MATKHSAGVYDFNDQESICEELSFIESDGWFGDICDAIRECVEGYPGVMVGIYFGKQHLIITGNLQSL